MKKIFIVPLLAVTLQTQASPLGFDINVAKESNSDLFKSYIYVVECSTTEFQHEKWNPPSVFSNTPLDSRISGKVDFKLYGVWRPGSVYAPAQNILMYDFHVRNDFLPAEQYFHFDGRNVLEDLYKAKEISVGSLKGPVFTAVHVRDLHKITQPDTYEFTVHTLQYGYDKDDKIKPVIVEPAAKVGDTLAALEVHPVSYEFYNRGSALASCSTYRLNKFKPPKNQ